MLAFAKYIIQNYLERVSLETLAGFGLIFSSKFFERANRYKKL